MSSSLQDYFLLECETYEDYLDNFVTRNDVRFLRNLRYCHMLVELGYRSTSDIYTPEQFLKRRALVWETIFPTKRSINLFSIGLDIKDNVLQELALRERLNNQKIISTIIFLKHRLKSGFEISGYIDYGQSLRKAALGVESSRNWLAIFQGKSILRPKPTDLSYFDWHKGTVAYNNSENYIVIHDVKYGLMFMHKGDHKKISLDFTHHSGTTNCSRVMCYSEIYGQVIIYDHIIRKKI